MHAVEDRREDILIVVGHVGRGLFARICSQVKGFGNSLACSWSAKRSVIPAMKSATCRARHGASPAHAFADHILDQLSNEAAHQLMRQPRRLDPGILIPRLA